MPGRFNIIASRNINKPAVVQKTVGSGSSYGVTFVFDIAAPDDLVTLSGSCFEPEEVDVFLEAIHNKGEQITVMDAASNEWTGLPLSLSVSQTEGTTDSEISLQLRLP